MVLVADDLGLGLRTHMVAHMVTLVPWDLMFSSGLYRPQAHKWYIYMHVSKILIYIKEK